MNIFNFDISNNLNTNLMENRTIWNTIINSDVIGEDTSLNITPPIPFNNNFIESRNSQNNMENYMDNIVEQVLFGNYLISNQDSQNVYNNSLHEEKKYINVISDNDKSKLNKILYREDICVNDTCPITQEKFKINEEIIVLPCDHGFKPKEIETWLEKKSHECPVCRYKFKYKEIKNEDYKEDNINIGESRNNFLDSINNLEYITHPFGRNQIFNTVPHSYISNFYSDISNNMYNILDEALVNTLNN
jgi:hypothetical protein